MSIKFMVPKCKQNLESRFQPDFLERLSDVDVLTMLGMHKSLVWLNCQLVDMSASQERSSPIDVQFPKIGR